MQRIISQGVQAIHGDSSVVRRSTSHGRLVTIEKQKTAANGRRRNANENFKMTAFVNE
jgi:hypothetical protein